MNDYEVRIEYPCDDLNMQEMFDYGYRYADDNPLANWNLQSVRVKEYPGIHHVK